MPWPNERSLVGGSQYAARPTLLATEQRYPAHQAQSLADNLPVMIAQISADGDVLFVNRSFAVWLGVTPADAVGGRLRTLLGEAFYAAAKPHLERAMGGDGVEFQREHGAAASLRHFHVHLIPQLEAGGYGLIWMQTDITDHKNTEEELKRAKAVADTANAAKSCFLANMSHEIRTPLGAVLGFSELLLNPVLTPAERLSYQAAIKRNGELLSNIINDILDLSKVEAGKFDIELQDVALGEVLTDLATLLNLSAMEKGLTLSVVAEGEVPEMIRTDPLRLRQILINIVGNAIKFTQRGKVEVKVKSLRAADGSDKLAFVVSDTGPGITAEQAERLFMPFTQADASTKRKHGGTGLGLALSKRMAVVLGGTVRLAPTAPGEGCRFTITIDPGPLPRLTSRTLDLSARHAPTVRPLATNNVRLDNLRILLVEDAPDNRLLVGRLLHLAGAVVELAENGEEAVAKVAGKIYDVVLMDLQMPVMDGFEATAALRRSGYTLPIIALTAHALKEERQRCLDLGFDDHICKPVDRIQLVDRLAVHLPKTASGAQCHGGNGL